MMAKPDKMFRKIAPLNSAASFLLFYHLIKKRPALVSFLEEDGKDTTFIKPEIESAEAGKERL